MNLSGDACVIREARPDDLDAIHALIKHYASLGNLLPRPVSEIEANLPHFLVAEADGELVGCASLELFTDELGEIRSLMIAEDHQGRGIASRMIQSLVERARKRNVGRVMALTYVPELFHKQGFRTVEKSVFPEKVWGICVNCYKFHNCDEIAVLLELGTNSGPK